MLVAGTTGAGKSSLLPTIALQTALEFKFIVVIDDGLSWITTCQRFDPKSSPIIVRANVDQTFNVFDTRGIPLGPEHLASATALCHLLVGKASDDDRDKLRAAVLSEAISQLYRTAYRIWRKDNPQLHFSLCRETAVFLKFQEARGIDTFLDAFLEARALRRALQDELHSCSHQRGPHQELYGMLASLLRPWPRDGRHGRIAGLNRIVRTFWLGAILQLMGKSVCFGIGMW